MTKVSIFIALLPYLLCTRTTAVVHGYREDTPTSQNTPIVRSNTTTDECGVTRYYTDETNRLIPNGETSLPGQWPWVVAIFALINDEFTNKFLCAGNLVSTRHIITAAHCLKVGYKSNDTRETETLYVALGEFSIFEWNAKGVVNREVQSYEIHPDYAHTVSADFDLAILTLFFPVDYNPFIQPICLWSESAPIALKHVVNKTGYVVGWGLDDGTNRRNEHSRTIKVPIMSQEDCYFDRLFFNRINSDRIFCAGLLNDESSPCNGFGGSGLVLYNAVANRYELRGIAARGLCAVHPARVIVYVDLAKYLPWIQQKVSSRR